MRTYYDIQKNNMYVIGTLKQNITTRYTVPDFHIKGNTTTTMIVV